MTMKTKIKAIVICMAVIVFAALMSCDKEVDVTRQAKSLNEAFSKGLQISKLNELKGKNDVKGTILFIERNKNRITKNVVDIYPDIKDEKNISFLLASGYANDLKSGDGSTLSGKFKNEILIVINKDTTFLSGGYKTSRLEITAKSELGNGGQFNIPVMDVDDPQSIKNKCKEWEFFTKSKTIEVKNKKGEVVEKEPFSKYLRKVSTLLGEGDTIKIFQTKIVDKSGREIFPDQERL